MKVKRRLKSGVWISKGNLEARSTKNKNEKLKGKERNMEARTNETQRFQVKN